MQTFSRPNLQILTTLKVNYELDNSKTFKLTTSTGRQQIDVIGCLNTNGRYDVKHKTSVQR